MRHRLAFLSLYVLAGCAAPANRAPAPAPAPAPEPTQGPAQPAPAPSLAPPPGERLPVRPPTASGAIAFDKWSADFYSRALRAGIPAAVLERELAGLTPDPRVETLDGRQPEFSKPVSDYLKGVVTEDRVAIGRRKAVQEPAFPGIEQRSGVPREILIGIWAMESGFGAIQGDFDVVRSMATLAAEGRRRQFAEDQLIAALKIIGSGEFPRARLRGSWAGAMGQTQFIPTTFLTTAVDGDGDGKRDIWGSSADALASAANLLDKGGWTRGRSWAREVAVPAGFDWSQSEGPRLTPAEWEKQGVKRADGLPWAAADQALQAQLAAPAGARGPAFLLFPNHFVIRKYNNSLAYALGVGMLADRVSGMGPLTRAWPAETPLSLADRMTAQRALAAAGFDPGAPDGVVGAGTRKALRDWQKARGLAADGYLSPEVIGRLKAEAGIS